MFSLWTRLIRKTVKPEVPAPLRRWPISRRWLCTKSEGDEGVSRQTEELVDLPAVAILGSAGTGKTFELNHLLQLEHARGRDVRHASLALLASGGKGLPQSLEELSKGAGSNTVICLDSLDEAIIPDRFAAAKLVEWLKSLPAEEPPRLRIACRSAVFTPDVAGAMGGLFKKRGGVTTAVLQPLDEAAIRGVATARNLDADEFLASVASAGATLLCQHPLTLSMLLDLYAKHESLPGNRNELFRLGTLTLAQERDERRSKHTHNTSVPAEEVLNAAGYLACLTLLGGKEVVDRSDAPRADALPVLEITYLADHLPVLTLDRLDAVAASGLCEGAGNRCFRFIHRQVAEYLAGMTIGRLPLHQARSLLESGLGWRMGVASPLRETAAFAAMANERIAEWIAETDPMVFGLSGVVQDDLRRRATLALVRKFTSRELTDAQVNSHSNEYLGLRYANAVNDLRPLLQDRSPGRDDILEFVVELAREWKLSELSDDLAALFLDNIAPEHPRIAAGYALRDVGTQEAKQRMKALLQDGHNDPQHQLRGLALRCNWPDRLTDTEVLTALRVSPSVNFSGAYEGFVFELADSRFAADGDRLAGLEWARLQIRRGRNHDSSSWRIAMRIAHAACKELSVLGVREHLARLLLRASDQYSDSPLGTIRYTKYRSWTDKEEIVE
ncbi:MAG TPA: hypothetical protein VHN77_00455, partial [Phycisphaerales bacterium]|nr:hypothetical protein [Phycisphaerales bacterium]